MRLSSAVATILCLACGAPTGPASDAAALMVTGSASYQLIRGPRESVRTTIEYVYSNRTGQAVSIPNCNGDVTPLLEKFVDGAWVVAWDAPKNDCLSPPVTIEPGEQYRDAVRLRGYPPDGDVRPRFLVSSIEGEYRLVWPDAVWDYDDSGPPWGESLPLHQRVSNRFALLKP